MAVAQVLPEYPREARESRTIGTVILIALVQRDGKVGAIKIKKATHPGVGFNRVQPLEVTPRRVPAPTPLQQGSPPHDAAGLVDKNF